MSSAEAKQARQEIDELLTSGRFERLETVSTHIFQMFGREWKEITRRNVLLHMFHDSIDDMTKLLARDCFEIIFNFVPLSASFNFTCLSRKFVRVCLNRFDKATPVYGFGFSNPREKELVGVSEGICLAEMGALNISSHSAPSRAAFSHTHSTQRRSYNPSASGYNSLLLSPPSAPPPPPPALCECAPSPYRQTTWDIHARIPIGSEPATTSPYMQSYENICQDDVLYDYSFHENCVPLPRYDAPDLSKLPFPNVPPVSNTRESSPDRSFATTLPVCSASARPDDYASLEPNKSPEDKVTMAERRVRALMDSIQPVGSFWDSPPKVRDKVDSPRASSRTENPAGVIGSPVKGKGGASSARRQTSNKAWKW